MKQLQYQVVTDKSIMETKVYLLALAKGPLQQDIYDIINASIDNLALQRKLTKRKDIMLFIFNSIKKTLDKATQLEDFEQHLVYLNILLDPHFKPMLQYKYNLFQTIIKNNNFTPDTYCILRHLIQWNKKQIPDFIKYVVARLPIGEQQYHTLATAIHCIEGQYKQAYQHLTIIEFDYCLEPYRQGLYHYSVYKYYKLIERRRKKAAILVFGK